jgi:hypothetical protein
MNSEKKRKENDKIHFIPSEQTCTSGMAKDEGKDLFLEMEAAVPLNI